MNLILPESCHHDCRRKKYSTTLVKDGEANLIWSLAEVMGTTLMGFYSGGERSRSTPSIAWAGGNLYPMSKVGGQWVQNY